MNIQSLFEEAQSRKHSVDCRLGPIRVRLHVPNASYPALAYFSDTRAFDTPDYELVVVDDGPLCEQLQEQLISCADRSFRAKKFRKGQYLLHHRAKPAFKLTVEAGRKNLVVGPTASTTVWAYYLKYFASHYGLRHDMVHLKAAAVANDQGEVTLIIGRSAGGKSVLMHQLVERGMRFVSNTHVLVKSGHAHGMLTAIRARQGTVFDRYLQGADVREHEEAGEALLRPQSVFADRITPSGPVRNVVVAHYGSERPGIRAIGTHELEAMLVQFAQSLNVYGLKEDLLDWVDDDLAAFSAVCQGEAGSLAEISKSCQGVSCDVDANDEKQIDELVRFLTKR